MHKKIAMGALVLVLAVVNWSIAGKEQQLAEGRVVYLELAPVDPRSLMQGDFMRLNFQISQDVYDALPKSSEVRRWRAGVIASDGHVIVELDENGVGRYKRIDDDSPLADNEVSMRYRVRDGRVKFATNAWFFQEGHANVYQPARYGQFRVDKNGGLLLAAMYDENLDKLKPDNSESVVE